MSPVTVQVRRLVGSGRRPRPTPVPRWQAQGMVRVRFCHGQAAGMEALPSRRLPPTVSPLRRDTGASRSLAKAGQWRHLQGSGQSVTQGRGRSQDPAGTGLGSSHQ